VNHLIAPVGLEPAVAWACAWVFGLLGAVTIALPIVRRFKPGIDYDDLMGRAKGWWIVIVAFVLAFMTGPIGILLFFGAASLVGLRELLALSPVPIGRPLRAVAATAVVIQYALVAFGPWPAAWLFLPVAAGFAVPVAAMLSEPPGGFAPRVGVTWMALMLAGFGLSQLPALVLLPGIAEAPAGGRGLILFALALAQFNDVAQYYWGKAAGKTLIVPTLSPKKTWAGFLGGVVTTAGLAWLIAPALTPIPGAWALLLGAGVAVAGFLGDLTVSALKREGGAKDSGGWLPGFGGVMDRLDSLVYVAPILAAAVWLWWLP
jgi:phosphatidate cytidylyltransferase